MTWREWLTVKSDNGKTALVSDPSGEKFRVKSAALDQQIQHTGDTDEAVAEYDDWCVKNIIEEA